MHKWVVWHSRVEGTPRRSAAISYLQLLCHVEHWTLDVGDQNWYGTFIDLIDFKEYGLPIIVSG